MVYNYRNKPIICANCQVYGHTKKWCKSEEKVCRRCSGRGHEQRDCKAEKPSCFHCQGEHRVGDRECEKERTEQQILDIQDQQKVTVMRARQILQDNNEYYTRQTENFKAYFDCTVTEEEKRKITPWLLEKCLTNLIGSKPVAIRTKNRTTFSVELATEVACREILKVRTIGEWQVQIKRSETKGGSKGLVYVYGYNMIKIEEFMKGLIAEHGLIDAVEAHWIRPKNNQARPLLLTFREDMPGYLDIPGERMKTRVFEYNPRPMMCRKCQKYGHVFKNCREQAVCARCSEDGHDRTECKGACVRCCHFNLAHVADSANCKKQQYEEEIMVIQTKERENPGETSTVDF